MAEKYNEQLPQGEQKVSLHGMDIYSFKQSRQQLFYYLLKFSPQAAQHNFSMDRVLIFL